MAGCVLGTTLRKLPTSAFGCTGGGGDLNCSISDAEDLETQVLEALQFLRTHQQELAAPGFAGAVWAGDRRAVLHLWVNEQGARTAQEE
jgi:hypothetical protein